MFLQRCNEYACLKGGAGMPSDLHCAGLYFACAVQKTTILGECSAFLASGSDPTI